MQRHSNESSNRTNHSVPLVPQVARLRLFLEQAPAPASTLRLVVLTISPTHRRLVLDVPDGVRSWPLRLAPSDCRLCVSDMRLFHSAESDDGNDIEEEEEEKEEKEEKERGCRGGGR